MKSSNLALSILALVLALTGCATQKPVDPKLALCYETLDLYLKNENVHTLSLGRQLFDQADQCMAQNQLAPKFQSLMYSLQADAAGEKMRDYPKAITAMENAIRVAPTTNPRDTLTLSRYYRLNGEHEKALQLVQGNIDNGLGEGGKGSGFHMPTYYHLGQALYDLGRYRESAEALSAGLRMQMDYAWAYWERGRAYEALEQPDDARADFQQFARRVNKEYLEAQHRAKLAEYQIAI